jgi:hypothetical protein
VHTKLPNYRVFVSVDMTIDKQPKMGEANSFPMQLKDLERKICYPYENPSEETYGCFSKIENGQAPRGPHKSKCFEGREWQTEIDAVISGNDGHLCFIEYEENPLDMCNNFMKIHRLKRDAQDRQIESLFITRSSNMKKDSHTDKFDDYMTRVNSLLDILLGSSWSVLVVTDLSRKSRRLEWYPKTVS